jgi:type III restriction enzyme
VTFLYEEIGHARKHAAGAYREIPWCIAGNLNPAFDLRPYQIEAFRNFITFFEGDARPSPTQALFHMATGSGKTLIMSGLVLYLYGRGYRNFLFFVHLDNIVQKTKENFLNAASAKYLFSEEISIDGEKVPINEVANFQGANPDAINICFKTLQGLHSEMWNVKEGGTSWDDFEGSKTVFISDEAHHLNVDTRRGGAKQDDETRTWEQTVKKLFSQNRDNVLLEFTATCDLKNRYVLQEYENKIVYDYPLSKYREEGYSKQIKTIRADAGRGDRALTALLFSQYRMKVFQDHRLDIKPVVLFKAKTIAESKDFERGFHEMVAALDGAALGRLLQASPLEETRRVAGYFASKGLGMDALAQELRDEFGPARCISANDEREAKERQIILNSLESKGNPYRAVFEVKKLDEGWDVLNLFDIVRLYETHDVRMGQPGPGTLAEAQLIGRGARYCPFAAQEGDERYRRKYDGDTDNPLRVCEELYYHCQYDSRYVLELNKALLATGIMPANQREVHYTLKDAFLLDDTYRRGPVFANARKVKSREGVAELPPGVRGREYRYSADTGRAAVDTMMGGGVQASDAKTHSHRTTIGEVARFSYSIVHAAIRRIDVFKFNVLRGYFPNLASMREFILGDSYLGGVGIVIESRFERPAPAMLYDACLYVLQKIGDDVSGIRETYEGTTDFVGKKFSEVFRNKTLHIANRGGAADPDRIDLGNPDYIGVGVSQNAPNVPQGLKIDLEEADWFVYNDNYGTSEEKSFVAYFAGHVEALRKEYEKVYLVRNERQLALYSFDGGERFEPDYLLLLRKKNATGFDQYQIFVEPKGKHLLADDAWKDAFLKQIEEKGAPSVTFANDADYRIVGLPFYCSQNEEKMRDFRAALGRFAPAAR